MYLELKGYRSLCSLEIFRINDIEADYEDFGQLRDICPECRPDYGCGYMKFIVKDPHSEVLKKYNISVDDYEVICDKLDSVLSFGRCAWCS